MSQASHANAALTPRAGLRLARLVVEEGWPIPRAAERFELAWAIAKKWADRYRDEGPAGMFDRSSRPRRQPNRTPSKVVRQIVRLRLRRRWGPVEIVDALGMGPSTVHAVLVRCRLNRLTYLDRVTGEPIRRNEHARPGDMLHMDVKMLGKVFDGGGWRYVGPESCHVSHPATGGSFLRICSASAVSRGLAVIVWPSMSMVTVRRGRRVWTSFLRLTPVAACRCRATARAANTMVRCASIASRPWWNTGRARRSDLAIRNERSTGRGRGRRQSPLARP